MEIRLIIAFSLTALLVLAGVAWAAFARHNTRERKITRQRAREDAARAKRGP